MDINITIDDQDAAYLAAALAIRTYADGNDLITQAVAVAKLRNSKSALQTSIARQTDQAVVDATIAAFNAVAAIGVPTPPIKVKPPIL